MTYGITLFAVDCFDPKDITVSISAVGKGVTEIEALGHIIADLQAKQQGLIISRQLDMALHPENYTKATPNA